MDNPSPDVHRRAAELRAILGPELPERDLYGLLAQHNNDVSAAVNAFFDPQPPAQQGQPQIARPVGEAPPPEMCQVTVPDGCQGGDPVRVETARGLMQVAVPAGLRAGDTFLMRLPPPGVAVAAPAQSSAYQGTRSSSAYPGAAQQPRVVVRQSPPIVVHSRPYYHPYGYGPYYGDPFLYGGAGLLGGMLIADAMFW